ncbi:cell envelope-like function transcriptional attenuator common domain protein [Acetomicrobium hydrogeniformans ATCC BAA-1850]|uniref:Cell envelope-like function transcriptional attenuator common domain protein n=2 Tax=Acetomicrobium hydrogeniformans TaxID=649746 RepID=A0A0T5XD94_9BACT|nr:cell envelope-like function transcriptional attenuator common domain protein [Acetomicrobium hydrogeniformans ATCC BAA-1850]
MAMVVATVGGAYVRLYGYFSPKVESIKESVQHDEKTGKINICIVGKDNTEDSHRADTILFTTLDLDNKTVQVLSIPRDTRVQIPGRGWDKINHAYPYGGIELLNRTLINYLGMPIHYYIELDYSSFPKIVDLLGGVDIYVEKRLKYVDRAGGLYIDIPQGLQHMDGETALKFVRFRHDALGDIGRIKRQQQFMKALLQKIVNQAVSTKMPTLLKEIIQALQTDLPAEEALKLAMYFRDIPPQNIRFFTLPGKPAVLSGVSYWLGDVNRALAMLSAPISEEEQEEGNAMKDTATSPEKLLEEGKEQIDRNTIARNITCRVAVLNGDGTAGLANQFADVLQRYGIDIAYKSNARHFDYHYTSILYPRNLERESKMLGQLLGISDALVKPSDSTTNLTIIIGHDYKSILARLESGLR